MHVRWLNLIFIFNTSTNYKVSTSRRLVWELVQNWYINKLCFQWHIRCINLNGWTNKKLSSQIYESNYERVRDVFKPLTWWDGEREVIGLVFGKKYIYKLFFIRAESSHEPSRPQLKLSSFNYRARLARARLARAKLARVILARARLTRARTEPELSHEPKLFCAALPFT
jgi:hypothetical protein